MRFLIRIIVFGAVVLAALYFTLAYRVIWAKDGMHLAKKQEWTWKDTWVDVRDWSLADYVPNGEIGGQVADIKWSDLKDRLNEAWSDLGRQLEDWSEELKIDERSEGARKQYENLRKEAKDRYDKLKERLEKEDITREQFEASLKNLRDWLGERYDDLKRQFEREEPQK